MSEAVKACPKCGTGRDSMRWPFGIVWHELGKGDAARDELQITCERCSYFWYEREGQDAQA